MGIQLQKGSIRLLIQQLKALVWKNALLSWRHRKATFLQIFSSLVFIALLFCVQKALEARFSTSTAFQNLVDPKFLSFPPIPLCEDKFYVKLPCFDFAWSGNSSDRVSRIVDGIRANNPGRSIPSSKVKSFSTEKEVDAWLASDPMHCPGALHFVIENSTIIRYGIQTNSTAPPKRGKREDPTFKFQIPLQIAAEREIARSLIGDPNFSWNVGFMEFAHPSGEPFSAMGTVGPTFILAITMFGSVFQMSSLVMEKELKLRQAMTIMGLYDTAYWLSWFSWEVIVTLLSSLLIVLFGMMFQFDFFLHNSFAVLFMVFFLFQLNMTALAFMISSLLSKSSSTTTVGFSLFIISDVSLVLTQNGFPYTQNFSSTARFIWSFFPFNVLGESIMLLTSATATHQDPGLSWSGRTKCTPGDTECVTTIDDLYKWLIYTFFLWFGLAIYLDNIIPNPYGVRKSIIYFLKPGYWTGKGGNKGQDGGICSCSRSIPRLEHTTPDDEDVLEEENNVKKQVNEGVVDQDVAVQLQGLVKTYPGSRMDGCCKCKKNPPYHALKGIWLNFAKDQLFCLLGPNGAGKTTVINCLTGITPVTQGDALVYGYSIRSSFGMSKIRKTIGVCPQFDILWGVLTGEEHLYLFGGIKGLPPDSIKEVIRESLAEVRLTDEAKTRISSYSGGMKRRLSVAIALIGDPKLVILDEPTTGMDPISRRHVWDIIEGAKRGRSIVLTTHSMEEADVLSDRIGIMAKGRLRCIGNSIRLKSRFGAGFVANVSFFGNPNGTPTKENVITHSNQHVNAVKDFFKSRLGVEAEVENKAFITFVIPNEKESHLSNFFAELQARQEEFGILDVQIGLTTLEEVFLNIAKQAELESAQAEHRLVTLSLTTSGASVQIPIGARFVGIPGTESGENPRGIMVEVYWEQDDSGALCISGHSGETPLPPGIEMTRTTQPGSCWGSLGQRKQVHGVVIDPHQIPLSNSSH